MLDYCVIIIATINNKNISNYCTIINTIVDNTA